MAARVVASAVLVALLLVGTLLLGIAFGGIGVGTSGARGRNSQAAHSNVVSLPVFVVQARIVSGNYLYSASSLKSFPSYMFAPLVNLKVVLVGGQGQAGPRLPALTTGLFTNSSGMGEIVVPQGTYTVRGEGAGFSFVATVDMKDSVTTHFRLSVYPVGGNVTAVSVVNQDTVTSLQPSATIYVDVLGSPELSPSTVTELVGRSTSLTQAFQLGVQIVGSYPAEGGTTVVLVPLSPSPTFPSSGVKLLQLATNTTVTYIAR